MKNQAIINGEFSETQLARLRVEYEKIQAVNPTGEAMTKINNFISSLEAKSLEKIERANIKWLSSKARTERTLRQFGKSLRTA